jgi:hypothetical protein
MIPGSNHAASKVCIAHVATLPLLLPLLATIAISPLQSVCQGTAAQRSKQLSVATGAVTAPIRLATMDGTPSTMQEMGRYA